MDTPPPHIIGLISPCVFMYVYLCVCVLDGCSVMLKPSISWLICLTMQCTCHIWTHSCKSLNAGHHPHWALEMNKNEDMAAADWPYYHINEVPPCVCMKFCSCASLLTAGVTSVKQHRKSFFLFLWTHYPVQSNVGPTMSVLHLSY